MPSSCTRVRRRADAPTHVGAHTSSSWLRVGKRLMMVKPSIQIMAARGLQKRQDLSLNFAGKKNPPKRSREMGFIERRNHFKAVQKGRGRREGSKLPSSEKGSW